MSRTQRYQYAGITEQSKAALKRWLDAQQLKAASRWRGAMYLAGYAIECQIKAALMKCYSVRNLEELERKLKFGKNNLWEHNLDWLLNELKRKIRSFPSTDRMFHRSFNLCRKWQSNWRYHPEEGNQRECDEFIAATDLVQRFIRANS